MDELMDLVESEQDEVEGCPTLFELFVNCPAQKKATNIDKEVSFHLNGCSIKNPDALNRCRLWEGESFRVTFQSETDVFENFGGVIYRTTTKTKRPSKAEKAA